MIGNNSSDLLVDVPSILNESRNFLEESDRSLNLLKMYKVHNAGPEMNNCRRSATCHSLKQSTCMGAKLPYLHTTQQQIGLHIREDIEILFLKYIPKCWSVIQPFLCAIYLPQCENGTVYLPPREMCKSTLKPCKILYDMTSHPDCDNETSFPPMCKNYVTKLEFSVTGVCMEPLITTQQENSFYKGK